MARDPRTRLFVYSGGFLWSRRIRRILSLAGYRITTGWPAGGDLVGVWGQTPRSHRAAHISRRSNARLVWLEDAWLRSLFPGRSGTTPTGLLIDHQGLHFDPTRPSDLETLLATHPLDDAALLARARAGMASLIDTGLTKYAATDPALPVPNPGYVLVVDQTREDAAVTASGADEARFQQMLDTARHNHPDTRIVIKSHPETTQGHRPGYFTAALTRHDAITFCDGPIDPWALLAGACAVYTVSSQLGFEAILAGHRPHVFGQPFYAGWGLTHDVHPIARRQRRLNADQLFAAAMLLYPTWYDPARDRLCRFEDAAAQLAAEARAWREDRHGWQAREMRLWKRGHLRKFFGTHGGITFGTGSEKPTMIWAGKAAENSTATRVEDGFIRSRGLGADLVPPLSLVADDLGIYYDPARPSRLEHLIAASTSLRPDQTDRAKALIAALTHGGLSKYNLGAAPPDLPKGHRILVPGQVEDDASVLRGAGMLRSNTALLHAARQANPDAVILYKPHPDVEAGLRPGAADTSAADMVLHHIDPATLLDQVQEVWTLTSLLGFEALLRGVRVTTLGMPFYAGWGLTTDLEKPPTRRQPGVSLPGLVHACLIDYPRYRDPISGLPCPVETIVERLTLGQVPAPGPANRMLSKLQGVLASAAPLWR